MGGGGGVVGVGVCFGTQGHGGRNGGGIGGFFRGVGGDAHCFLVGFWSLVVRRLCWLTNVDSIKCMYVCMYVCMNVWYLH